MCNICRFLFLVFSLFVILVSCSRAKPAGGEEEVFFTIADGGAAANRDGDRGNPEKHDPVDGNSGSEFAVKLFSVINSAELSAALSRKLQAVSAENSSFITDLLICLKGDFHLRELVDKQHPLPRNYAPAGLVTLNEGFYRLDRAGLTLRSDAAVALGEMAAAARADGITVVIGSAYRSYDYQENLYNRYVREMGREAADRESARPGHSQHQTGLVVDFSPIDDAFAATDAGRWMAANASRFGWSLSFPAGYEAVTGYKWESWHYRYVGRDIAAFIDNYFDGIQQYALRFLHEWALYPDGH